MVVTRHWVRWPGRSIREAGVGVDAAPAGQAGAWQERGDPGHEGVGADGEQRSGDGVDDVVVAGGDHDQHDQQPVAQCQPAQAAAAEPA